MIVIKKKPAPPTPADVRPSDLQVREQFKTVPPVRKPHVVEQMLGFMDEVPEQLRDFPTVDTNLECEHECPRCGYRWSGDSTIVEDGAPAELVSK